MELSATATVILGFLSNREMSGYDIKSEVDNSTRFFWAASYGQIYPELKRLSQAGLVEEAGGPTGERRRTAYRITGAGGEALRRWLLGPNETLELRHEGLLKVFFADALPRERRNELLDGIAGQHRQKLAELRKVAGADWPADGESPREDEPACDTVLRFGIEFQEWVIDWCDREIRRNRDPAASEREATGV
jgi:DNA-binding PadR family transcriptional regulator